MRLDINLAREPFRSHKLFYALAAAVGVLGLVVLAVEVAALAGTISARSRLGSEIAGLQAAIAKDRAATTHLASTLQKADLQDTIAEAATVRSLVLRRRFDWDGLFRELEAVLPGRVKLTAIQPQVQEKESIVVLEGVAKSLADQNDLVQKLEESQGFSQVFVNSQSLEGGVVEFSITAHYRGLSQVDAS